MTPTIHAALDAIEARVKAATEVINEQASEEVLWSVYLDRLQPISEAHLQQELRKLHACYEGLDLAALTAALRIAVEALESIQAQYAHSSSCYISPFVNNGPACSCGTWGKSPVKDTREALASIERILGGDKP